MKFKAIALLVGTIGLAGTSFSMLRHFYLAYTHDYALVMLINVYGEAIYEAIIYIILIPFMVYSVWELIKLIVKMMCEVKKE